MQTALIIIHVVIAVILTVIVLMQHGKQQGLSGAIAGGAETFFGKNKGKTVDAMLKKFTAVVAILFIVSSVALTGVSISHYSAQNSVEDSNEGQTAVTMDENGNLVDENGNIVATSEDLQAAQTEEGAEGTTDMGVEEVEGAAQDVGDAVQDAAQDAEAAVDMNAADTAENGQAAVDGQ